MKIAGAIGLVKLMDVKPEIPADIRACKDIVYKEIGERKLRLDIYQQKKLQKAAPVLIFIHGGGWKKGDKADYLVYLLDFAGRGYVTATISYRFSQEAKFPAAVEDVKCAVRWLRTHAAEYHIDTNKMAVIGGSAGGHLAMMIGYSADVKEFDKDCEVDSVSSRVQAVVNLYGPTDLTTEFAIKQKSLLEFIGQPYDSAAEIYRRASPLTYITSDDPPTLIFHGTIDDTVPVGQSDILKAALDKAGVANEYHRLKGWPHTMDLAVSVNNYCRYYMNAFFEKYIPIEK
ncbi:MAG TPA: alpha/beta hydrolase [Bacteroidetes bacterium]|nr:alpha/beta hydrolase [Bacteroidota bacterium]